MKRCWSSSIYICTIYHKMMAGGTGGLAAGITGSRDFAFSIICDLRFACAPLLICFCFVATHFNSLSLGQ
jgi:hypothetical protein